MENKKCCNVCSKYITPNNIERHERSCKGIIPKKIRGIDFDPNRGYKAGTRTAWNKGIKSKQDLRDPEYIGKIGGYRANAGRSKKFKVVDSFGSSTTLQSTYELKCKEILDQIGILWVRPKALKYDNRNYFADFYLPEYDIWLDPKNDYKAKQDEEKIRKVIKQNNVNLYVLRYDQINVEYITSLTRQLKGLT